MLSEKISSVSDKLKQQCHQPKKQSFVSVSWKTFQDDAEGEEYDVNTIIRVVDPDNILQ